MTYKNSLQIRDRRAEIRRRADEIIGTAKREVRELTDDERAEIEAIKNEVEELKTAEADLKARIESLENPVNDEEPTEENNEEIEENKRMKKQPFRLVKAIRAIANGQPLDAVSRAVINAGAEEARRAGINAQGQIQIPVESRATVSVQSEGEDIVATEVFDLLTPLRAKNVLVEAGARFYSGMTSNVQLGVMGKNSCSWEGEISTAKDGAGEITHKTLSPKRLSSVISVSRTLLAQDSLDIEMQLRNDLVAAINSKLEATILGEADGSATQPEGIFHAITPTEVSTFADIVDLEATVQDADVNGECRYILSNKAKAAMRTLAKGENIAASVYADGEIDGTPALATSNVGGTNFIYGDFSNLAIAQWNSIDVCIDPYTKAADNQILIVVNAFFDSAILREEAFATGEFASE